MYFGMKKQIVKVGKRGQVTIPAEVRRERGFKEGSYVEISEVGGVLTLRKLETKPGVLDLFKEVGEALRREGITKEMALELSDEIKREVTS